jgi:Outer membrane protein beta-barrel domain
MFDRSRFARAALAAAALAALSAAPAAAQAWTYPTFQQPRVVGREFNFAVADGEGTSLLFQWREGISPVNQLSFDAGYVDPDVRGADGAFFVGGQFGRQVATANANMPFDMMLTAGANVAFFDGTNFMRIPVGLSAGHRFPLEGGLAITPFVHPRLSFDRCSECGVEIQNGNVVRTSESDLGFDFDLGGSFEFNQNFAVRLSATLGGSDFLEDGDSFGISFAWTPGMPVRRR